MFHINVVESLAEGWDKLALTKICNQILTLNHTLHSKSCLDLSAKDEKFPFFCSVKFSNDEEIQVLNKQFRGKDKPTNVLSFPDGEMDELDDGSEALYLGDIILAFETVYRESQEQSKDLNAHIMHLLIHGILHLMGYDHETDDDALEMEALEIELLKKLGLANPYENEF